MTLRQRASKPSSMPLTDQLVGYSRVESDGMGFRAGFIFSALIAPLFVVNLPLFLAWGWLLYVCMFAVFFAPKALFWLAIGTYVLSGFVHFLIGDIPSYALFANSLSLHEAVWASVSFASIFSLLTRPQEERWPRLHWILSKRVKLALSTLVVLVAAATVNTFLFGSEGRWSTAIRFGLPAIPLVLALRSGFIPEDLPVLIEQLRRIGVSLLVIAAAIMLLFMPPSQRSFGFFSHLIMIGLIYTWLELLTASPTMRINRIRRGAVLLFGVYVYFILGSGNLSDMWMFAWATALGLLGAGALSNRREMATLGGIITATLIVGVFIMYLAGPNEFISGNNSIMDVNFTTAGGVVNFLGDSGVNLADRFVRWHIAVERIVAEPFALQFGGYGSQDDLIEASRIYGYTLSNNLVAHNAFLDIALWLSPLAPFSLIFLLWRFWQSMLQTAAFVSREYQLLLGTCAIAAPLFWIRDFWGTWIVQSYFGASFCFWLVIVLGLAGATISPETHDETSTIRGHTSW